jgi:hypothetical protein
MDREDVIRAFNELLDGTRDRLIYSKWYPIFEEMYELFRKDLEEKGFIRKENDYLVIIRKNENEE